MNSHVSGEISPGVLLDHFHWNQNIRSDEKTVRLRSGITLLGMMPTKEVSISRPILRQNSSTFAREVMDSERRIDSEERKKEKKEEKKRKKEQLRRCTV